MRVLKFGGSSIGTPERIKSVIEILSEYQQKKIRFAVVFSAFQGITDSLISISQKAVNRDDFYINDLDQIKDIHFKAIDFLIPAQNSSELKSKLTSLFDELDEILRGIFLVKELTLRTLDFVMSFGEQLSCTIIDGALNAREIDSEFLDSRLIIKTDDNFGNARINFDLTEKNIADHFAKHKKVQVVTGFIGSTDNNETTTIGRGGSDYTASILGAALNAEEIEIWTDVNGILTADPRKVNDSYSLNSVTYEEAMEMSHFGAKVIHPPTMKPALIKKIPIRIKNTFNPAFKGTVITESEPESSFSVKGISSIDDITLLRITGSGMVGVVGIASRIFSALAKANINVILITQASSEHSVCFAVLPQQGKQSKNLIEEEFKWEIRDGMIDEVIVEADMSIIAVVGENMRHTPGISGKVFQALGKNGINIIAIAQGSSELNISLVISKTDLKKALNVLHNSLFLSKRKILNLFLVGPGLVGSALLRLLVDRNVYVSDRLRTKINVTGLMNRKKMFFDESGIEFNYWETLLGNSEEESDIEKFIERMKELNLPNSILVDCTANDSVVKNYLQILNASISIVTPNKIANTQSYDKYLLLREAASKKNVQFRYGTNVGSALPVISTLKDIIANGDEVVKIEGIFSGTLSFIFNTLKEKDSFSDVVKLAKEKGYTEPDPRDDLSGLDMSRKLLILIRESGVPFELKDIEIEKLISQESENAKSIEDFFELLKKDDERIIQKKKNAAEKNCVLSYIARYENGKARLAIEEIEKNHPFSNLTNSENIVAFTTKNYWKNPLVIRGQGAGADFTAVGILSDILRISNYLS
ncbi:MAG: bifunctional aspartate kinase/homoserine dehydrogenase I [Ignavibacteriales bacterium]|nr:bifunctional aspartate kinase/homoserine dehydrogenase I [Ignavibacteriales bacterium]